MYVPGLHDKIGDIVKRQGINPDENIVGLITNYLSEEEYDLEELDDEGYVLTIYNFANWVLQRP